MPELNQDLNLSPTKKYILITPGAGLLPEYPRGLYIGSSGDVTCEDFFGNLVTFTNAQAGSVLPIACIRVTAAPAGTVGLF